MPGRLRLALLLLRAAARRPARGALVVAGLLAASLATTASLVAADSLERLFVADARADWPGVDVEVTSAGEATFGQGLRAQLVQRGEAQLSAASARLVLPVVPVTDGRREPQARLIGIAAGDAALPPALEGTVDPQQLGPDDVVVGARLAERLGLTTGDPLDLVVAVPQRVERDSGGRETSRTAARAVPWDVTVRGVARDQGVVDLGRTANLYARLDQVQRVTGLDGRISAVHLASREPGDEEAAEALVDVLAPATAQFGLRAEAVQVEALEVAAEEGGLFRGILLTLALLVAAAAAVVTVQLLVLLGQERARELAVLRAVGVRQRLLVTGLALEGTAYALAAALLGVLLGVPLAGLLARSLSEHFAAITASRGREQVALELTARPGTVTTAVLLVLLLAAGSAWLAARQTAARAVDAALRGAPEPPGPLSERRPRVLVGTGLFLTGAGVSAAVAGDLLRFSGLSLLLAGGWLVLRRRAGGPTARARLDRRASALGLLWCLVAPALLADVDAGVQTGFGLLAAAGAGAVSAAVVLATARSRALAGAVRAYLPRGRAQVALQVAGAYGELRRDRAATVASSVGVVTFMVAALAVLGSTTALPPAVQGGGWDVVGTSVAPVDPAVLEDAGAQRVVVTDAAVVPETAYRVVPEDSDESGAGVPYPVRLVRLADPLVDGTQHRLAAALPGLKTAEQALQAVSLDQGAAVVDRYALPQGAVPGDEVVVRTARGPRTFRLLAVLDTFVLQGVLVNPQAYTSTVPGRGPRLVLAAAPPGTAPGALAAALERAAPGSGLVADSVAVAAERVTRTNRVFTDVFGLMLLGGLLVSLAAVGVLVGRAGRERRPELAVLRALGLRRRTVLLALVAEPLLAGAVGLAAGLAVGLATLRLLLAVSFPDLPFRVAGTALAGASAAVAAVLVVACLLAALRASRVAPAAALRDLG